MNYVKKIFVIAAVGVSTLFLQSCGSTEAQSSDKNIAVKRENRAVRVEVISLKAGGYGDFIVSVGSIKPLQKANISTSEGGIIENFAVDKGRFANEGDVLFTVENSLLKVSMIAVKAGFV